jgi:putative nucleotidyltransferase with HDIG domain
MQFFRQLSPAHDPEVDASLESLLSREELQLVNRLTVADRRHLLETHATLHQNGWQNPELLKAALLHDIGKADETARVTLVHRVVKVLLGRFFPGLLRKLASNDGGWLHHGLYLAVEHPRLGAEMARKAGTSDRTCWLIAHHHDGTIRHDAALLALRDADEEG